MFSGGCWGGVRVTGFEVSQSLVPGIVSRLKDDKEVKLRLLYIQLLITLERGIGKPLKKREFDYTCLALGIPMGRSVARHIWSEFFL